MPALTTTDVAITPVVTPTNICNYWVLDTTLPKVSMEAEYKAGWSLDETIPVVQFEAALARKWAFNETLPIAVLEAEVITRIEYVPDEEVGLYFSAADVVVLPYTESYQSAVLYMAYSFARPVVASAVGGLTEVVEDGRTGLLVPPADASQLANGLLAFLKDTAAARAMGERGRVLVETKFGWPEIARQTAEVYRGVLRKG